MNIDRFKFRAWHKPTKRLFEVWTFNSEYVYQDTTTLVNFDIDNCVVKTVDCVLEQCTGLKDRNGRLIYEGDVIELTRARRYLSRGDKLLVKYDTDRYCGFGFNGGYALTKKCAENCIVIGNIHENPRLLEGK